MKVFQCIHSWQFIAGIASAGNSGYKTIGGSSPSATVSGGVLVGTTTSLPGTTVNKFLGIPFAEKPVRFEPPVAKKPWTGSLNATAWGPACIQQFVYPKAYHDFVIGAFNTPPVPESEDCLFLNVYAPTTPAPKDGRAVMFWIFGGSLQFGTGSSPFYDGSYFAGYEDVIIVTINYRTNVFGFPTSPELPVTKRNLGFLDQRLALKWVSENIKAFGGDPKKVTIFGESAGSFSVDALVTSYPKKSQPPFRAAIMESGQYSYRTSAFKDSPAAWYTLSSIFNCSTQASNLTCLRAANASLIKDVIEKQIITFSPVVDNITLMANPALLRTSGNIANVSLLAGSNAQESRLFSLGQNNLTAFLQSSFGFNPQLLQAVKAAYPLGKNGLNTDYDVISQISTELVFQCGTNRVANATAAIGIPAWRYYFNASFPNTQALPGLGVYHASEIPLVFTSYPMTNVTAQQEALSKYMRGAWAHFAKNPIAGPGWNAVGTGGKFLGGAPDLDVGVLGANGSAGVTVIRESDVDYRCPLFYPLYDAVNRGAL